MSPYLFFTLIKTLLLSTLSICQLVVNTSNGQIEGHFTSRGSSVVEFLGIPFAQPPVGSLRFSVPERYSGNESYVASHWVRLEKLLLLETAGLLTDFVS